MAEADAERYMRHTGWLKLYRGDRSLAGTARERAMADELGLPVRQDGKLYNSAIVIDDTGFVMAQQSRRPSRIFRAR